MEADQPLTPETREKLLTASRDARAVSEQSLNAAVQIRQSLQSQETEHDDAILNAYEFALLLQHDLGLLLESLVQEESRLATSLYARLLVLTLYESSLRMRNLLAKDFRIQMVEALHLENDDALKLLHKRVSQLFEACRQNFGEVRHGLAGHWTHDPDERHELIDKAEVRPVVDLAIDMLGILAAMVKLFWVYFSVWLQPRPDPNA